MKLSTAAVIIAAGTSNVSSPNVVLAGKAGKLAPKASKAKAKAKAVKAHPSLSYGYGSGSYSMSTGPPPPPCPCWSESELSIVTAENVDEPGESSCVRVGGASTYTLKLTYETDGTFNTFEVAPIDRPGTYECAFDGDDGKIAQISEEEFESCAQQITNRCDEIGYPVTSVDCPCFDEQDLLVVTSENVDDNSCNLNEGNPFTLSTSRASFGIDGGEQVSCFLEQDGGRVSQDIEFRELTVCFLFLSFRCGELGLIPDNVGEGTMLSKMLGA